MDRFEESLAPEVAARADALESILIDWGLWNLAADRRRAAAEELAMGAWTRPLTPDQLRDCELRGIDPTTQTKAEHLLPADLDTLCGYVEALAEHDLPQTLRRLQAILGQSGAPDVESGGAKTGGWQATMVAAERWRRRGREITKGHDDGQEIRDTNMAHERTYAFQPLTYDEIRAEQGIAVANAKKCGVDPWRWQRLSWDEKCKHLGVDPRNTDPAFAARDPQTSNRVKGLPVTYGEAEQRERAVALYERMTNTHRMRERLDDVCEDFGCTIEEMPRLLRWGAELADHPCPDAAPHVLMKLGKLHWTIATTRARRTSWPTGQPADSRKRNEKRMREVAELLEAEGVIWSGAGSPHEEVTR